MARLLTSGLSLRDALQSLVGGGSPRIAQALASIQVGLDAGEDFSQACARSPQLFSPGDLELIRAAERIGRVPEALEAIAGRIESVIQVRRQLAKTSAYPLFVLSAAIFLNPLPKLIFVSTTAYLSAVTLNFGIIGALIGLIVWGIPSLWRSRHGPRLRQWMWGMPWPATLYVAQARASFATTLEHNLAAGLPLFESLNSAGRVLDNPHVSAQVGQASEKVRAGADLSGPLAASGLIAPDDQMLLTSGERSGTLVSSLQTIAQNQREHYVRGLNRLLTIIGALLMIAVFVIVAMGILHAHDQVQSSVDDVMNLLNQELPINDLPLDLKSLGL